MIQNLDPPVLDDRARDSHLAVEADPSDPTWRGCVDGPDCPDRITVWTGTPDHPVQLSDVEAWLTQACTSYDPATVVLDPWQAIGLAQRLQRKRIRVEEYTFSATSVGRLATTIHLLLREHRLALPADQPLLDELANVRLRETTPGVYRMDHDPDKHDDQAIALALAANHLITRPRRRRWGAA